MEEQVLLGGISFLGERLPVGSIGDCLSLGLPWLNTMWGFRESVSIVYNMSTRYQEQRFPYSHLQCDGQYRQAQQYYRKRKWIRLGNGLLMDVTDVVYFVLYFDACGP